jgi:hypothetical protein
MNVLTTRQTHLIGMSVSSTCPLQDVINADSAEQEESGAIYFVGNAIDRVPVI